MINTSALSLYIYKPASAGNRVARKLSLRSCKRR